MSSSFKEGRHGAVYAIALNRPQEGLEALQTIDTSRVLIGWTQYWERLTAARHMLGECDEELIEILEARAMISGLASPDICKEPAFRSLVDHPPFQKLLQPTG